ncbi:MAG TPA: hypothetical protein PLW97_07305 [Synergistaceae bacterium]|nr:hypothetical protein [Synergistaceae bacterium]
MASKRASRHTAGWWLPQLGIRLLGILLGVLFFWLLGFVVTDIRTLPISPSYQDFRESNMEQNLEKRIEETRLSLEEIRRNMLVLEGRQNMAREGIRTLEATMRQLAEMQKLSIQKNASLSGSERENLKKALNSFLTSQEAYQKSNEERILLAEKENALQEELRSLEKELREKESRIRRSYGELQNKEALRRGLYQLAFLIPLLLACIWITKKSWNSLYRPGGIALTVAVFARTAMTAHASFPFFYMKYTLLGAGIIVAWALMVLIARSIQRPRKSSLLKTYREGYRHFLCPVCEYPIRRGPLRFFSWTRKTIFRLAPPGTLSFPDSSGKSYTCPSCGTLLYSPCEKCGALRETLLPYCSSCGAEASAAEDPGNVVRKNQDETS